MNDTSHASLRDEATLLGRLAEVPPWAVSKNKPRGDRALRTSFRHWSPADGFPSLLMLDAVYSEATRLSWFVALSPDAQDASASRIARALHVFALDADDGRSLPSFGAACGHVRKPGIGPVISTLRFARLVNAPPSDRLRLEALGRAFRRFGSPDVQIRVAGSDAPNVLRFLFAKDPSPTVTRWAGDYFRTRPEEGDPSTESAAATAVTDAPSSLSA